MFLRCISLCFLVAIIVLSITQNPIFVNSAEQKQDALSTQVSDILEDVESVSTSKIAAVKIAELTHIFIQFYESLRLPPTDAGDNENSVESKTMLSKKWFDGMKILCEKVDDPDDAVSVIKKLFIVANEYNELAMYKHTKSWSIVTQNHIGLFLDLLEPLVLICNCEKGGSVMKGLYDIFIRKNITPEHLNQFLEMIEHLAKNWTQTDDETKLAIFTLLWTMRLSKSTYYERMLKIIIALMNHIEQSEYALFLIKQISYFVIDNDKIDSTHVVSIEKIMQTLIVKCTDLKEVASLVQELILFIIKRIFNGKKHEIKEMNDSLEETISTEITDRISLIMSILRKHVKGSVDGESLKNALATIENALAE